VLWVGCFVGQSDVCVCGLFVSGCVWFWCGGVVSSARAVVGMGGGGGAWVGVVWS
jgi:hypothetical protein